MANKGGTHFRMQLWQSTGGRCWYCGSEFDFDNNLMQVDHIDPNDRTYSLKTCRPACRSCNSAKQHRTTDQLREIIAAREGYRFTDKQIAVLIKHGIDVQPILDLAIGAIKFFGESDSNAE